MFDIRNFAVLNIFGQELWITETMVNLWIISAIMIAVAIAVRLKVKYTDNPKGFQNIVEMAVETFDRFVRNSAGNRLAGLGNWFFTVFVVILLSNISGVFTLRPPTADWTFNFPVAFVTFILIQFLAFKFRPREHFKSLMQPFFLFLPINIIGELSRPISLSFRLFGNIMAGMILIGLLYNLLPWPLTIGIPIPLHAYFDLAMGLLQAFIFTVLSLSFIGIAAGTQDN